MTIAVDKPCSNIISKDSPISNNGVYSKSNQYNKDDQITFINYTYSYCICIIDIVDSTKITQEAASSEKIRSYYSIFLNTMASIIKHHNGKVIKNAGDCIFYYFSKTVDAKNEYAFQDVLDCSLAMIEANSKLNSNLNKNELPSISYRISGNYGKVELATSTHSTNIDLFGPTVNTCSKINHLAKSNEMVISKDLYDVLNKTLFFKDYCFNEISKSENKDEYYKYPYSVYSVYSVYHINNPRQQIEREYKKRQNHAKRKQNKQNQANSSFNILLVDDDEDILFIFTTIIKGEGYNTTSFSNPYKALDHFSQKSPYYFDLVILDIRMPGINGIKLYSKIKAISPDIKVIFISALDAGDELLSIFPDIKSNEIIRKPVKPINLLLKVKTILRL